MVWGLAMSSGQAFTPLRLDFTPDDAGQWECPTLLDLNAIDACCKWLVTSPDHATRLSDERWRIGVLERQVQSRPNSAKLTRRLEDLGIEQIEHLSDEADRTLSDEIQRAYFGGAADSRPAAELLAYGRRHSETGSVRIISRHRAFRLVPQVQLYFIPDVQDVGEEDDAVLLRLLLALDIHPQVRRAAFSRVITRDYPVAVAEATKTLIKEVRTIGETHGLTFVNSTNDQPMMDQAFQCTQANPEKNRAEKPPQIRLNNLQLPSEWSEQKGYRDLMCGVVSAVRNPNAHDPAHEEFLQSRFGDPRTALKFLCLISLLFEKLDARTGP